MNAVQTIPANVAAVLAREEERAGLTTRVRIVCADAPTDSLEVTVNAPGHPLPGVFLHAVQASLIETEVSEDDVVEAGIAIRSVDDLDRLIGALQAGRRALFGGGS